eukprot:5064443-Amphidinium_carterae.3
MQRNMVKARTMLSYGLVTSRRLDCSIWTWQQSLRVQWSIVSVTSVLQSYTFTIGSSTVQYKCVAMGCLCHYIEGPTQPPLAMILTMLAR